MSATTDYANMDGVPSQTSGVSPLKAADWNTFVRDNFDAIKFGHLVTTVAGRPTGVANGTMIYETDTRSPMLRSNGAWVPAGLAVCGTTGDLSGFTATHEGLIAYETTNDRYRRYTGAAWAALVGTDDVADSSVTTAKIADASSTTTGVTNAKIRYGASTSVIGRSSGTAGAVADIAASADGQVLKRSSGALGFASVVNADVDAAAAIAYSKLALSGSIVNADVSSSAAIAYSKLALSGSIVNADISASAAIAYSKLALSGSIVNADISASAAIADSKLATISTAGKVANSATTATSSNLTNRIVTRDGNGNFSAGTITADLVGSASSLLASSATVTYSSGSDTWTFKGPGGTFDWSDITLNTLNAIGDADIQGTIYQANMPTTTSAANVRRQTSAPYALVYNSSSRRFKTNIEQYVIDPDKLLGFRGVTYTSLCEGDDPDLLNVGFIAEEAEEAGLSEFVDYAEDGMPQNFNYAHFTAAILELCKYQEQRINDLEARISALEAK